LDATSAEGYCAFKGEGGSVGEGGGKSERTTHGHEAVTFDLVHPEKDNFSLLGQKFLDSAIGEGADKALDMQGVCF